MGQRLREAREYLGFSQEEAANHLRISRSALSNIESGQRGVDALELKELAKLYERPATYFTGDEGEAGDLPTDVKHLAREASKLSSKDREELARFAQYLSSKSNMESEK